ncbi:unnamed protein product [Macrosiphum euphorbiae]|uniref:Uncharacterized protein n=1 Tax=Macrosiphum euphorbiae TaxID=13131 RepID=A0AAV0XUF6_9HEMI|nr:unnamed protein product [Macrosiphum euphorbiae]
MPHSRCGEGCTDGHDINGADTSAKSAEYEVGLKCLTRKSCKSANRAVRSEDYCAVDTGWYISARRIASQSADVIECAVSIMLVSGCFHCDVVVLVGDMAIYAIAAKYSGAPYYDPG